MSYKRKNVYIPGWDNPRYFPTSKKQFIAEVLNAHGLGRSDSIESTSVVLAVGGDGVIIRAAVPALQRGIPIIGYHTGTLGFLTSGNNLNELLQMYTQGQLEEVERTLLDVNLNGTGVGRALNEIAILSERPGKLIEVPVTVNDSPLTTYSGDGVVVSTPAGSTAYNMSAGGPIATPDSGIFCITPLAPFSLSNRPIVVNDNVQIKMQYPAPIQQVMVIDGYSNVSLSTPRAGVRKVEVMLRKSNQTLKLLRPPNCFFKSIREKLGWANQIKS